MPTFVAYGSGWVAKFWNAIGFATVRGVTAAVNASDQVKSNMFTERYPFLCTLFLKYYHLETNYGKTRI